VKKAIKKVHVAVDALGEVRRGHCIPSPGYLQIIETCLSISVLLPDYGELQVGRAQGDAKVGLRDPLVLRRPRRTTKDTKRRAGRRQRH
jgi:hypothetical protein